MGDVLAKPAYRDFISQLRRALAHLDDPTYLESLPLLLDNIAGGSPTLSRAHALRRALRVGIDRLAPSSNPDDSLLDARTYELLYRYAIGRESIVSIAQRLHMSERQAYRELRRATDALAQLLLTDRRTDSPDATAGTWSAHTELARLSEAGLHPVALAQLVTTAIADARALATRRMVQVTVEEPFADVHVRANRVVLRQAVLNLLSHLIHRSAIGQRISVQLKQQADVAQLMFTCCPGTTCTSTEPHSPWAMALQIIALMGGTLCDDVSGDWRTVTVSLPLDPDEARPTVLIVDDNQDMLALLRSYLREQPYRVFAASGRAEALDLSSRYPPDVLILDIIMPHQDGWEILQELRRQIEPQQVRVIVCSVINDPELSAALGAHAFLSKPVSEGQLIQALRRVLASAA
ncbi:MAG: response regulator [Anaerolineae bacterium]